MGTEFRGVLNNADTDPESYKHQSTQEQTQAVHTGMQTGVTHIQRGTNSQEHYFLLNYYFSGTQKLGNKH